MSEPQQEQVERPERWLPLRETAEAAGTSVSAPRHRQHSGVIVLHGNRGLVDLDKVLQRQAAQEGAIRGGSVHPIAKTERDTPAVWQLHEQLSQAQRELGDARTLASASQAEAQLLRARIRELETWLDKRATFEEVEHLQLGRLLALKACAREERPYPLMISLRLLLVLVYLTFAAAFVWALLTEQI